MAGRAPWSGRLALILFGAVLGLPVLAGLAATVAQARGQWPAAFALPGLARAAVLSLTTGLAATLAAVVLTGLILALRPPGTAWLLRLVPALLALPHAGLALGLGLLLAPSGPLARLAAPAFGWTAPPGLMIPGDAWGLTLTLGLVLKETPFLLALALAAHGPEIARQGLVAATLGTPRAARFGLVEWPALYARLRLPVVAVLTYGMTTVDMGMLLGPSLPAPLAVEIAQTASRGDLGGGGRAAALGLIQLGLVALALILWRGIERAGRALAGRLIARGTTRHTAGGAAQARDRMLSAVATAAVAGLIALPAAAMALLVLWSLAPRWPFPALWPPGLTVQSWAETLPDLLPLAATTLALALVSTGSGLVLTVWLLATRAPARIEALIWLPLILPQVSFLPGLARALIPTGLGPWPATLAAHLTFVLPYLWLVLAGPWRSASPALPRVAASLGARPWRVVFRLRLPLLAPSLALALAIGVSVSTGQYLATLLPSGGRLATLTTEAVALAGGTDRARIAALALSQSVLPLAAFLLALRVKAFPSPARTPKRAP